MSYSLRARSLGFGGLLLLGCGIFNSFADSVEMRNGDRYSGTVVSMTTNQVTLQSETLGTVKLPRSQVAGVSIGTTPEPKVASLAPPQKAAFRSAAAAPSPAATNALNVELPAMFRQMAGNSNVMNQVKKQFLGDAGPEANAKFDELMNGMMNGSLSVDDIRAQAQATVKQLRSMNTEESQELGGMMETYLGILEKFLNETPPSGQQPAAPSANSARSSKSPKPPQPAPPANTQLEDQP